MSVLKVFWFALFFVVVGFNLPGGTASADLVDDRSDPAIVHDYFMSGTFNPSAYSNNTDCQAMFQQVFNDTPWSCRVRTAYGYVVDGKRLLRNGTNKPGDITGTYGNLRPIPNSGHLLSLLGDRYTGYKPYLYKNVAGSITTETNPANTYLRYRVESSPQLLLPDNPNVSNHVSSYGISFSGNGEWMATQTHGESIVRINIRTGESFYFGEAIADTDRARPKTAISSDGRYVVLGSGYFQTLKLYDLDNCTQRDDSIHHDCASIDMEKLLQDNGYDDFNFTEAVRFRSNESVYVQFISGRSMPYERNRVLLMPEGYNETSFDYIGLGDSFASGEGAFEYKPETDVSINSCRVSLRSYPFLLGSRLGMESYDSVACSGAVIEDVWTQSSEYAGPYGNLANIGGEETSILNNFYPGIVNQSSFIEKYKPEYITVSAIGNDIGFDDIIKRCLMPDTCYKAQEDRVELTQEINQQIGRLENMYNNLLVYGHAKPHIYAIGYPQIANPQGNCGVNVRLDADELAFAEELIDYLNQAIEIAAARAGVVYVDVSDAFVGHKLCDTTSNSAMHGLTAGTDTPDIFGGPAGRQSYHPTAFGHFLLQAKITEKTDSFNKEMPDADPTAWFSSPEPTTELRVSSPDGSSGRNLAITRYDKTIANDHAVRGESLSVNVDGSSYSLQAKSTYEVWVYSEPVLLGKSKTDERGVIEASLYIPESLEDGYHTIKITGDNVLHQPIVIYKTVYVSSVDYARELASPDENDICVFSELFTEECEVGSLPEPDFQPDNPKPPTDSPETEAGAEQSNEQQPENDAPEDETTREDGANTIQSDQPTTVVLENAARSSATTEVEAEPQIAGATDNKSLAQNTADSSEQVAQTDTTEADATNTTWLGALLILLTLSGLSFVIYKVARK